MTTVVGDVWPANSNTVHAPQRTASAFLYYVKHLAKYQVVTSQRLTICIVSHLTAVVNVLVHCLPVIAIGRCVPWPRCCWTRTIERSMAFRCVAIHALWFDKLLWGNG